MLASICACLCSSVLVYSASQYCSVKWVLLVHNVPNTDFVLNSTALLIRLSDSFQTCLTESGKKPKDYNFHLLPNMRKDESWGSQTGGDMQFLIRTAEQLSLTRGGEKWSNEEEKQAGILREHGYWWLTRTVTPKPSKHCTKYKVHII